MHSAVRDIWIDYTDPLEGTVRCMYADVLGLVTVGLGNLIDPMPLALGLPWKLPAGIPATKDQVAEAWTAVKNDPKAAKYGWKYAAAIPVNNMRLDLDDVHELVLNKLESNDRIMQVRFPDWEDRPADAQLAVHSMAWAMGPYFWTKFPKFNAHFSARNYASAAKECNISPAVGTVIDRNSRNRLCLLNADRHTGDPSILVWPAAIAPA